MSKSEKVYLIQSTKLWLSTLLKFPQKL